jgi:hypothetical protein
VETDSINWSVDVAFFSLPLALRFARPFEFPWLELVPLVWAFLVGTGSSGSSCFKRFVRLLLLLESMAGRVMGSFVRGRDSEAGESGDLEVLAEADGAERLPERRVSRGERGGPIVEDWAINW